ncbi:helix-turn-helix transcriptional regulator [Litoribacter ruber]|uniref:helix-turn-helix domain-containing protein n=1 Tax=Litoribacter ruber TaxID=702568 RepID=UPI001BDB4C20|nr:helix-turn-helix transcriptional regulator [Litoribacter ruber]MBT0812836.1 helix-turn-helix transcriptional regulator [Litoribacter ruber]
MAKKSKFELAVIEQVKRVRESKGFSQADVASFLECDKSFIGQIESPNSNSKYNLNHVNRLAFEMNCSPRDLIPETGFWEELSKKKKSPKNP